MSLATRVTSDPETANWICCQIGAREHYAIPAYLHRLGRLRALLTDAWVPPGAALARLSPRLGQRFERSLASARIHQFATSLMAFEAMARLRRKPGGWPHIMARNEWFQDRVIETMAAGKLLAKSQSGHTPVVLAYSYAARRIFRAARAAGARTLLAQIDPGPLEEDVVAERAAAHSTYRPAFERAPARYWELWREECSLADQIIVNSRWSRDALIARGIVGDKIQIVPLCFEPSTTVRDQRSYPEQFTAQRPLRVLFLGSLIVRKGIVEALEAARLLAGRPVQFEFVGPPGVALPADLAASPQVRWIGSVPRGVAATHFGAADVFLLPTHSDGFALTQLEAMAAGLPVVASCHCGEVVSHGGNGLILAKVDASSIAEAIVCYIGDPGSLARMSSAAATTSRHFAPELVLGKLLMLGSSQGGDPNSVNPSSRISS